MGKHSEKIEGKVAILEAGKRQIDNWVGSWASCFHILIFLFCLFVCFSCWKGEVCDKQRERVQSYGKVK